MRGRHSAPPRATTMVLRGQDVWRRHPIFRWTVWDALPGIREGAAAFAVFVVAEWTYKRLSGDSHVHGHGHMSDGVEASGDQGHHAASTAAVAHHHHGAAEGPSGAAAGHGGGIAGEGAASVAVLEATVKAPLASVPGMLGSLAKLQ